MSLGALAIVSILQAAALVVFVAALCATHALGRRRDRGRVRDIAAARAILRAALEGDLPADEAAARLDRLHPATLDDLLHEVASRDGSGECEVAFDLLRRTAWHDRTCADARSRRWWRRLRAARAISTLAAPRHLLLIHELLDDPTPATRLAAAAALERLPSPGLAAAVLERAIASRAVVRGHLIELLAASRTLVVPVIVERLRDPASEAELRVLLDLVAVLGYPPLLGYVVPHADEPSLEIRIAVATCLRNFPHPQASGVLRRMLSDPEWQVRARAAASLGVIGAVEATGDLLVGLRDPSWWVRLRSAVSLRLLGASGVGALRAVDAAVDRYAFDMARYVLGLEDGAMAEYLGGATPDGLTAPSGSLAV